ncbi:MAG: ATP-grasp domain-containing protein [Lachnospiraceae bacterium]|nr:ATP-grasp domain-containing protein [Lachnospiraceae bacterium]
MAMTIVFPSSILNPKKIDEDMFEEYQAVLETEELKIILFDYDSWFNRGRLKLTEEPENEISAVYRGWMMKPEQYADFFSQLFEHHIRLVTTPEMYRLMHVFPNIYPFIAEDTAKIMTFPLHTTIDVQTVKKQFRRFMVKDFVKSVKGTEFPVFFDQSVSQEEFDKWMNVFYKYRAGLLTGGICIKEYLELKKYGEHTNEYRVFYINHEIASVCRNSLQDTFTAEPPMAMVEKYKRLDSVFYTIDYAELSDGTWRIIEAGDGSVSGLSVSQNFRSFFKTLYLLLN